MKIKGIHIILLISGILFIILLYQIFQKYNTKDFRRNIPKELLSKRDLDIVFGNDSATLAMYVYSSYQCEYCRKFFNEVFPKLDSLYIQNNQLKVVMRLTASTKVKERKDALKACVCINKYGNFTYLHKLLLSNFKVMYSDEFIQMIEGFKDKDPFVGQCIDGSEAKDYLIENMNDFKKYKFKGTPTFIIGNQVYMGFRTFDEFQKIINANLKNIKLPNV